MPATVWVIEWLKKIGVDSMLQVLRICITPFVYRVICSLPMPFPGGVEGIWR